MKPELLSHSLFKQRSELIFAIPMPKLLRNVVQYAEFVHSLDYEGPSINMEAKKKYTKCLDPLFAKALNQMSKEERVQHYFKFTQCIMRLVHGHQMLSNVKLEDAKMFCFLRLSNSKWSLRKIQYCYRNHFLSIENEKKLEKHYIDLSLYLHRKSKNKTYYAFVLQACDNRVAKALRTLSIGFSSQKQFNLISTLVKQSVYIKQYEKIKTMFIGDPLTKSCINSVKNQKMNFSCDQYHLQQQSNERCRQEQIYFSFEELSFEKSEDNEKQTIESNKYCGSVLGEITNFPQKFNQSVIKKNNEKWDAKEKLTMMKAIIKENLLISNQQFQLYKIESNILFLKIQHRNNRKPEKNYDLFKFLPSKQIESIDQIEKDIFQIHTKSFQANKLVFRVRRKILELSQKQIIVHQFYDHKLPDQGSYEALWVFQNEEGSQSSTKVLMKIKINQTINSNQNLKFLINYLKGVFQTFSFYDDMELQNNKIVFFPTNSFVLKGSEKVKTSQKYLKNIFEMKPFEKGKHQYSIKYTGQNIMGEDWSRQEQGGLQYLNQEKIAPQKSVVKYVLKQMSKNLLSGKSILNLSLPVQIFSKESHLQRLLHSYRLAPVLLQQFSHLSKWQLNQKKVIQILEFCAVLGISNSLLYLSQQKSFNPILGETSQQWIDGCPAYAQQICHHPPISAFYILGRGYKIYGSLEAKVELGLNSGKGSNDGEVVVQFENGLTVRNYFPTGQVSGLSYGKRKFSITTKSYHFIQSMNILLEVNFEPEIKGTNKNKSDYFKSKIRRIEQEDIAELKKKRKTKSLNPYIFEKGQNQVQTLHGNWTESIFLGQKQIKVQLFQISPISKDLAPLPSDSIWREDIYYRNINDLEKSQQQKCRLQQLQRNDRKQRQRIKHK